MIKDEQQRAGYVSIVSKDGSLVNVATIEQTGWIPADAGLPESYVEVFVYPPPTDYCNTAVYGKIRGVSCWYYIQCTNWGEEQNICSNITHWQPLFNPPVMEFKND